MLRLYFVDCAEKREYKLVASRLKDQAGYFGGLSIPQTLKLGQQAMVYTDAFPDTGFAATLRHIGSRAEFTPKEVQTPDERVKLVYAVKLYLDSNPQQQLTPGIPADAVVRWKDGVAWQKPRW